jgi:molecular chaperone DnaJ
MKNPYEVLGINENASIDEIKKAYHEMAKKYHPDQYGQNPLRDLAEEKMREINEAYDYLMKNNNSSNTGYESNTGSSYGENYQSIRMDIQNGNLSSAEQKLGQMKVRDAEWNYLMGILCLRKGWNDDGYNYISNACSLDPSNFEYRSALNNLMNRNQTFRQPYYGRNNGDPDMCRMCMGLWCADNLCECFGGDLVPCC